MALDPQQALPEQPLGRPLRAVFFGTPALAVPTLDAMVAAPQSCEVVGVVSQPDKPAGRGKKVRPTPVAARATELGLPLRQPRRIRSGPFPEWLEGLGADVFVVIAYGRILTTRHLETPRHGCINVHASLLPAYRGAGPIQWALIHGERVTGVTTMWMEEGLDTGPMLQVAQEPIAPDDTASTLGPRLAELGAQLLVKTLTSLRDGELKATPQPELGVSHAPLLTKDDGRLRWQASAQANRDRIRGVSPWPGAWCPWGERVLKVHEAEVALDGSGAEPGTVISVDDGIVVACGEGALRLTRVQPPNKRPMSADAFLRGYALAVGDRLQES